MVLEYQHISSQIKSPVAQDPLGLSSSLELVNTPNDVIFDILPANQNLAEYVIDAFKRLLPI
jgi:hypothetical protein